MKANFCEDCAYYTPTTETCDYWLIEDRLRGCPGGPGCDKKITKKEYRKMNPAGKWDKAAGMKMWQEGKTDKEIAEAFCVTPSAVFQIRKKKWEPAKAKEEATKAGFVPVDLKDPAWKAVPAADVQESPSEKPVPAKVQGPEDALASVEADPSTPLRSAQDDMEGKQEPEAEDVPQAGESKEDPEYAVAKRMITMLEDMTGHLKGMDAVMTAHLVTVLYGWDSLA